MDGGVTAPGESGNGEAGVGQGRVATISADELLSAHREMLLTATNPEMIEPRQVIMHAIEKRFGRERLGLPEIAAEAVGEYAEVVEREEDEEAKEKD